MSLFQTFKYVIGCLHYARRGVARGDTFSALNGLCLYTTNKRYIYNSIGLYLCTKINCLNISCEPGRYLNTAANQLFKYNEQINLIIQYTTLYIFNHLCSTEISTYNYVVALYISFPLFLSLHCVHKRWNQK